MALVPHRTRYFIIFLTFILLLILYFKYLNPPQPAPAPNLPPTPTLIPTTPAILSPTLIASPSASVSPTPMPQNPQTGWNLYQNNYHRFTLEFPSTWQLKEFGGSQTPMITLSSSDSAKPLGLTLSAPSWGTEAELAAAKLIGPFVYQGWNGHRYQMDNEGTLLTVVSATKSAALGRAYRINWISGGPNGDLDRYLKPLLTSLKFIPPASNSAQPRISE